MLLCIVDLGTVFSHLFYCLFQFFHHKYNKFLWISTVTDSMSCWCLILIKKFVSCAFIYFYVAFTTSIFMQFYTCSCKGVIIITIVIDNKSKFLFINNRVSKKNIKRKELSYIHNNIQIRVPKNQKKRNVWQNFIQITDKTFYF